MKAIKTTEKVLKLILDGEFHSGEQIGASLGISRSAIWKAMHELTEQYEIKVESVSGKGYRLAEKVELLDREAILKELNPSHLAIFKEMVLLNQVSSTNDYLLEKIQSKDPGNMACFAEQQTKGKGRRGRTWISPFAHNIYHSLLWSFAKDTSELIGLTLAVAVAVIEAIQDYLGTSAKNSPLAIKWPNDIYYDHKKLSGILVEMSAKAHEACQVVIGVGINTHLPPYDAQKINQSFTSLAEIEKKPTQRNRLAGIVLNHLIHAIQLFEKEGLKPFLQRYSAYDYLKDREIELENQGKKILGFMRGISEQGALLIEIDGKTQHFFSGETSVRLTPRPV